MTRMNAEEKRRMQDEARWKAEEDARTLRRAEEIKLDSTRVKKAQEVVNKEYLALSKLVNLNGTRKGGRK